MAFIARKQEYIIKREGEYPTPVYHSVVSLARGHDLLFIVVEFHNLTATWLPHAPALKPQPRGL